VFYIFNGAGSFSENDPFSHTCLILRETLRGFNEQLYSNFNIPMQSKETPETQALIAPPQVNPVPAVQVKQCSPVAMEDPGAGGSANSVICVFRFPIKSRAAWLKSQSKRYPSHDMDNRVLHMRLPAEDGLNAVTSFCI
jgi:hypothetical protein